MPLKFSKKHAAKEKHASKGVPEEKSRSGSSRERRRAEAGDGTESRKPKKFLPNFSQLQEAVKELPDAAEWPERTYTHTITVDDRPRRLEFVRKRISRGSEEIWRWIYEGRVLIRNRDL